MIVSNCVDNQGVSIYYLTNNSDKKQTPLVIVPGLTESAEDYTEVLKAVNDRLCVVLSLRGRGKSDAPLTGYSLDHHVSDIEAVISALGIEKYILLGYSRGVSYALCLALKNKEAVKGIILGDYPPLHSKLPDSWVETFINLPPWKGIPLIERMPRHVFEGIQRESEEVLYFDQLEKIVCPVLLMYGVSKGSALSEDMLECYKNEVAQLVVEPFEGCGHNLFEPDETHFLDVVIQFLKTIW